LTKCLAPANVYFMANKRPYLLCVTIPNTGIVFAQDGLRF
jgi:hypothetical protein